MHRVFEKLDFRKKGELLRAAISAEIQGTHLEEWIEPIEKLVAATLAHPLEGISGNFCLEEVAPDKMKKELPFLYASIEPMGFIKGFVDLFFEHQGYFYIIDWKSNALESYSQEGLQAAMEAYDYKLQAELYKTAAIRYLSLFDVQTKFAGVFYVFLRGIDGKQGVYRYV